MDTITIQEALKNIPDVRITHGWKWLVWDVLTYTVFEHTYHAKTSKIVYRSDNFSDALRFLVTDDDSE